MSDTYKLQYGGMTLAYPGWGGYVGYEDNSVQLVQFGAAANATATLGITATFNGETTSWNNAGGTAYKDIPVGSEITVTASTPEYFRCGCGVPVGLDNFTSAAWSRGFSAHGTVTGSGYATTTTTQKNTFTARGTMYWTNQFNGSYQGARDAYPELRITGFTSTYIKSASLTGGVGTSYGATGTSKAGNFTGNRGWKSFGTYSATSLKKPVNCSAWRISAGIDVGGQHNQQAGYGTEDGARVLTASVGIDGTGTAKTNSVNNGWFPSTTQGTKTGHFNVTATAAKLGTATNPGSYVPYVIGYSYGTITVGSGGFYSWAHNRITSFSGPWTASGIMP